ncbi:hypothetical protein AGMMS49992_07600 [Clostridia bacterium]|nr:hypothetical protein AGMMS49992_07600 [Clostridia bacterium]
MMPDSSSNSRVVRKPGDQAVLNGQEQAMVIDAKTRRIVAIILVSVIGVVIIAIIFAYFLIPDQRDRILTGLIGFTTSLIGSFAGAFASRFVSPKDK